MVERRKEKGRKRNLTDAYEICVQRCKEAGIRTIADLKRRVVS